MRPGHFLLAPDPGAAAQVRSQDPLTGDPIELTIGPDDVEQGPNDTVVSFVYPDLAEDATPTAVQELFCGFERFSSSIETAQRWFRRSEMPADLLTVDEAFTLGSLRFGDLIAAARTLA